MLKELFHNNPHKILLHSGWLQRSGQPNLRRPRTTRTKPTSYFIPRQPNAQTSQFARDIHLPRSCRNLPVACKPTTVPVQNRTDTVRPSFNVPQPYPAAILPAVRDSRYHTPQDNAARFAQSTSSTRRPPPHPANPHTRHAQRVNK